MAALLATPSAAKSGRSKAARPAAKAAGPQATPASEAAASAPATAPASAPASAPAAPRQRVAIFDLRAPGLPDAARRGLMDVLTKAVAEAPGLSVISRDEIAAMLDAETQKQLMGCDQSSCLAEIAGALDVDFIISAAVTPLGQGSVVSLQFINQRFANVMNRCALTWPGDPRQLPEVIEAAAQLLVLEPALRRPAPLQVIEAAPETEVFVDEKSSGIVDGQGALTAAAVDVGVHALRLVAPGRQVREIPFVIRSGRPVRVNGATEPIPFYTTWWFWGGVAAVAAVAVGGVVAGVLLFGQGTVTISAPNPVAARATS
ncbi:MAG: hypothetical protein JXR83_14330 [Deltaproteobacteria bacterium]|nr:hypothetical protein [Deltaproteobacteria bacterium]